MNGEQNTLSEQIVEHQVRKACDAQAMAEPLPGPTKQALAVGGALTVGKFTVEVCCDGHIEYLSQLNHPLNELRLRAASSPGKTLKDVFDAFEKELGGKFYRGPNAWVLCQLFTVGLDETDALVERGGLDALRKAAKKFSRLPEIEIRELTSACICQYLNAWVPMLTFEAAESDDDDAPKKKSQDLPMASG